ncbi:hypothetical protein [Maricaulis sp.]|uniref:hypothetical protein n=2 Tax=Maricaulis sp. TaxID=1486257 RepID=UPI0032977D0C
MIDSRWLEFFIGRRWGHDGGRSVAFSRTLKVVLHIGRHKTGTSSVQRYLSKNREALKRDGVLYPDLGILSGRIETAHHEFVHALQRGDTSAAENFLREIERQQNESNCSTLVLSSESFQNIKNSSSLKEMFSGHHLYTICYIREIVGYYCSSYAQFIHANNCFADPYSYLRMFDTRLGEFVSAWYEFSHGSCFRYFNKNLLEEGDIVQDFCHHAELPYYPSTVLDEWESNVSIGGNLLYFKLICNAFGGLSRDSYYALGELAGKKRKFREKIPVPVQTQSELRSRGYNTVLKRVTGCEPKLRDYSKNTPFPDVSSLREDIELILDNAVVRRDFDELSVSPTLFTRSANSFSRGD